MLWYFGICVLIIAAIYVDSLIKFIVSIPSYVARGVERMIGSLAVNTEAVVQVMADRGQPIPIEERWEYRLGKWSMKKYDRYANWLDHQFHTYRHTGKHRMDPHRHGVGRQTDVAYLGYLVGLDGADEEWADTLHGLNAEGVGSHGSNNM